MNAFHLAFVLVFGLAVSASQVGWVKVSSPGGSPPLPVSAGVGEVANDPQAVAGELEQPPMHGGKYRWHTFYGTGDLEEGLAHDVGYGIAFDKDENIFITGISDQTWLGDHGEQPLHPHSASFDVFVLKLNKQGAYQWHTFYGSDDWDLATSIEVDDQGNVYVMGISGVWLGDHGEHPLHEAENENENLFILKLNNQGSYIWHTFYGEPNAIFLSTGGSIVLDEIGDLYIIGGSDSNWKGDLDQDPIHPHASPHDLPDVFVLKLTSAGEYLWHTFYGSMDIDFPGGGAVDLNGNLYISGFSAQIWLGDDNQEPTHSFTDIDNVFILKLDNEGNYQWHTFYGSNLDLNISGGPSIIYYHGIFVTGTTSSNWLGDNGTPAIHPYYEAYPYAQTWNLFVLRLDENGAYQWHTFYGEDTFGNDIASDGSDGLWIIGPTYFSWLGDGNSEPLYEYFGNTEAGFVLKLTVDGAYKWHAFFGKDYPHEIRGITSNHAGSFSVTGGSVYTWDILDNPALHLHTPEWNYDIFALNFLDWQSLTLPPGGSASTSDDILSFTAPPSLPQTLTITYTPNVTPALTPIGYRFAGITFELEATGADGQPVVELSQPLTLNLSYDPSRVSDGAAVEVLWYDPVNAVWVGPRVIAKDPQDGHITIILDHFSEFALWEQLNTFFLPLIFK